MLNDKPIHLTGLRIFKPQPHTEPSVTIPVWLTQSYLDGMQALIQYCAGVEHSGKGRVPGSFEVIMFYRTIQGCIEKAEEEERKRLESNK